MAYRISLCAGGAFFVPAKAADGLRFSGAAQLRVLLCFLCRGNCAEDFSPIAGELNMTAEDVLDALDYWVEKGVLEKDGISQEKTASLPKSAGLSVSSGTGQVPTTEPNAADSTHLNSHAGKSVRSAPEISRACWKRPASSSEPDCAFVLKMRKPLRQCIFPSSDTLRSSVCSNGRHRARRARTVVEYCKTAATQPAYIQKVALEWQDAGLDNREKAEEAIACSTAEELGL